MEFTDDGVVVDKSTNGLDRLVLDVTAVLEDAGVRYAVVSGYVVVLFGRARSTEDVDVVVEPFGEAVADELATALQEAGYWGPSMPLDELHPTLADGLPVRVAEADHRVPNVELKFASDEYDRASIEDAVTVQLPDGSFRVGSLELQIAYKLGMGAQKDLEDALYLHEVLEGNLNTAELETYARKLGVEDEYEELRSTR